MMISRNNYEIYFLDYFEGRLDKATTASLFAFLDTNPDLKNEFGNYYALNLEPDKSISFRNKDRLKKDAITFFNYKTWLIKDLEHELNVDEKNMLNDFIKLHPALISERDVFSGTRLKADTGIVFRGKLSLKRNGRLIPLNRNARITLSAAAAIALFIITYYSFTGNRSPEKVVVDIQPEKEPNISAGKEKTQASESKPETGNRSFAGRSVASGTNHIAVLENKNVRREEELPSTTVAIIDPIVNDSVTTSENNLGVRINPEEDKTNTNQQHTIQQIPIPQNALTDIFDEEELAELKNSEKQVSHVNTKLETLADLASSEIQRISRKADISISKNKNDAGATTYAFSVGKLSFSHTKGN